MWIDDFHLISDAFKKSPLKARVNYAMGTVKEKSGDIESAIHFFKKALELDPMYIRAKHHLFHLYYKTKKFAKAIEVIESPPPIYLEHPEYYETLMSLYIKVGNFEKAEEAFNKLIKIEPSNIEIYITYSILLIEENKPERAINVLERALKSFGDNPVLFNNLGIAYEAAGMRKKAEESFKKAILLAPDAPEPKENLHNLLSK